MYIIFFIFVKTFLIYEASKFVYLLFSIISIFLLIFSFRKKSIFYENFFGVFIFLGFWLKFSIIKSFDLGYDFRTLLTSFKLFILIDNLEVVFEFLRSI